MDLTQLANLGEFIGGVAVLVTLVYLAVQVRHGNKQTAASLQLDFLTKYNDVVESVQSREHAALIVKMKSGEPLDAVEDERAGAYAFRVLNMWHAAHQSYEYGLMNRTQYETVCSDVQRAVGDSPGFQEKAEETLVRYPLAKEFEIFRPVLAKKFN